MVKKKPTAKKTSKAKKTVKAVKQVKATANRSKAKTLTKKKPIKKVTKVKPVAKKKAKVAAKVKTVKLKKVLNTKAKKTAKAKPAAKAKKVVKSKAMPKMKSKATPKTKPVAKKKPIAKKAVVKKAAKPAAKPKVATPKKVLKKAVAPTTKKPTKVAPKVVEKKPLLTTSKTTITSQPKKMTMQETTAPKFTTQAQRALNLKEIKSPSAVIYPKETPNVSKKDYMNAADLEHFRQVLLKWKQDLMAGVDKTIHHMQDEAANFADPNDRATQEEEFSLELRTRDRERKLMTKIDDAIERIENGDYGFCDECGIEIGRERLEARPTATLCIDCKTLDEIREKQVAG
jgi:DnaK suppressor protein